MQAAGRCSGGPNGSLSIDDEASAVPDAYGDVILSRDRHRRLRRRLLVEVDRKWKIDRGSETILLGDGCRQMRVIIDDADEHYRFSPCATNGVKTLGKLHP